MYSETHRLWHYPWYVIIMGAVGVVLVLDFVAGSALYPEFPYAGVVSWPLFVLLTGTMGYRVSVDDGGMRIDLLGVYAMSQGMFGKRWKSVGAADLGDIEAAHAFRRRGFLRWFSWMTPRPSRDGGYFFGFGDSMIVEVRRRGSGPIRFGARRPDQVLAALEKGPL